MVQVTFTLSDDTVLALHGSPEQAGQEVRLAAAVKLYELGRLTSGAAAELAGIPRTLFLTKLADFGVPTFRQSADELAEEMDVVTRRR